MAQATEKCDSMHGNANEAPLSAVPRTVDNTRNSAALAITIGARAHTHTHTYKGGRSQDFINRIKKTRFVVR